MLLLTMRKDRERRLSRRDVAVEAERTSDGWSIETQNVAIPGNSALVVELVKINGMVSVDSIDRRMKEGQTLVVRIEQFDEDTSRRYRSG